MVVNNHIDLMRDDKLINLVELEDAEYIGSFEHQGRICDYYCLVNDGKTSFISVVRDEQ